MRLPSYAAFAGADPYDGGTFQGHRGTLWYALQTLGLTDTARNAITTAAGALTVAQCGYLEFNAAGNSIARTLPASGLATDDALYIMRRVDSTANTVVISPAGADTIEGLTSISIPPNSVVELQLPAGSTNWRVIGLSGANASSMLDLLGVRPVQNYNLWDNSDFAINQRVLTSVADGAYANDRTYALTETGNVTISQLAQPTDGIPYAVRLTQPDVGAKRIGLAQVVEARKAYAMRGERLVFAPKLRLSVAANLRVALLSWGGTADAVTRDVVNNWASGAYTPGNFFNATSLTVIACGSVAAAANTWTDVPISSISTGGIVAPSTMANLIMFAWTEGTLAQNGTLDASLMRAGRGTQVPIWTPPDPALELAKCQRFYEKSYDPATAPGTATTTGALRAIAVAVSDFYAGNILTYKVQKRVAPTLSFWAGTSGVAASFYDEAAAGSVGTPGLIFPNVNGGYLFNSANLLTAGRPYNVQWAASADL